MLLRKRFNPSHLLVAIGFGLITNAALSQEDSTEPSMSSSLMFQSPSTQFIVPVVGDVQFRAVATGIGMHQTNPVAVDNAGVLDVSNAQVIVHKNTGLVQFYLQSGYYSTPSLGTSYQRANRQTIDSFGVVPLASISLAPSKNWLFTAGKINSFGGFESTFTFQNINIDRGLLWNQTSNVSKGFAAHYNEGSFEAGATWNDGFYSNQLNWLGFSAGYHFDELNSVNVSWTGSVKASATDTFITPLAQNNSQISNLIYTYKTDRWLIVPYLQYTYIPQNQSIGLLSSAQTKGVALLANYRFSGNPKEGFSLPLRFEYISSAGRGGAGSPNLLYGIGSAAWSATITPTYQAGKYFLRGELSYVQALNVTSGYGFGNTGTSVNQARAMLETGILY